MKKIESILAALLGLCLAILVGYYCPYLIITLAASGLLIKAANKKHEVQDIL